MHNNSICMYIFEYIFKHKYALYKECKTKNIFLKSFNHKTYFYPNLIICYKYVFAQISAIFYNDNI